VDIRVSRIAIASSICTLIGLIFFVPGLIACLDPLVLHPQSKVALFTGFVTFLATGSAFILGIGALIDIVTGGGRRTGYGFAVTGAATPFFLFIGLLFLPTFGGVHAIPSHMVCGTNLSGIGKAMLIYANDYNDELPLAGGRGTAWGPRLKDWAAASRSEAFGLDPNGAGAQATISSSLYLLARYEGVPPEDVCLQRGSWHAPVRSERSPQVPQGPHSPVGLRSRSRPALQLLLLHALRPSEADDIK
jgi:hypothetical protein